MANHRIHLAPLQGMTNRLFRKNLTAFFKGYDSLMTPFIFSIPTGAEERKHFKDIFPLENLEVPVIPQILGDEKELILQTATRFQEMGYTEVNLNLGCPHARVAKKGRGSGLLGRPDTVVQILGHLCAHLKIGISVKMRLGMTDREEILRLIPRINPFPISRVIIHARIASQMYEGEPDLEGFGLAMELCEKRVIYNGDVKDLATFRELSARFPGIHDWMIGRWAIANPFLAEEIKADKPVAEKRIRFKEFHDSLFAGYRELLSGDSHLLDKMKELWQYFGVTFPENSKALKRIRKASTVNDYSRAVKEIWG